MRRSALRSRVAALTLVVLLASLVAPSLAQAAGANVRHRSPAACKSVKQAKVKKVTRKRRRCDARRVIKDASARTTPVKRRVPKPAKRSVISPAPTAALAAASIAAPAPTAAPAVPASPVASGPVYWGAWIGSHLTGVEAPWDAGAIESFERHAGKRVSLVNFSTPFANCFSSPCKAYAFPAGEFNTIHARGAIPFFSWANDALPVSGDQTEYQLADVIAGRHDSYITAWATAAKAWGHPFFLRFDWEMNGRWFPWSEGVNGNVGGEYVAAWRHVHDIFTRVGATNTTWVWCPNIDPGHAMQPLGELYPGDGYVDWTCLDGYNANAPRQSFKDLFKTTYDEITAQVAPGKPMIVGETGSTESGGSKAEWISDMFTALPTSFPQIRGLQWFDKFDDGMDWPIETSASATAAFAAGVGSSRYLTGASAGPDGLTAVPTPTA